ncbi:MAG: hypothetical protein Q8P18_24470 [Pseudomonadota bacterium]|nr:hypothetical protein [Pseudomonadota bacterium]
MHLFSILLVGCLEDSVDTPRPDDRPAVSSRPDDGPATLRPSDSDTLSLLDDDAAAVIQYEPVSGWFASTPLGATPGRLARRGGTAWVTLPAARGIAVLEDGPDGYTRTDTLPTGAEPLGIAVNADATRLYVALATSGEVQELTTDGEVLRTWPVEGQPSWLALRPEGDALYVGSAFGGVLTWIDLVNGAAAVVELPTAHRGGLASSTFPFAMTNRITGDPSVSTDGRLLAVPMLLVDTTTRISAPNTGPDTATDSTDDGYASNDGNDISRINPVVGLVQLGASGAPDGPGAALVLVTGVDEKGQTLRSYLSSAAISPAGDVVLATMEASAAVIALSPVPSGMRGPLWVSDSRVIRTPAGPRATAFMADDRVYIDSFLDRAITSVSLTDMRRTLNDERGPTFMEDTRREVELDASPLPEHVLAGRALFYSAIDTRMAAPSGGVSCSTCHTSGRTDGLSWNLERGYRQTPSLAGGIAATAPFTWASGVATVAEEAELTSEGRMGGRGLSDLSADVAAYIESIRAPDVPELGSEDAAIARGEAIFHRADVGCGGCHGGALYTDNRDRAMFGLDGVNTPSLRRISATAPYLHDGRAPTLRALLELSVGGAMGDTSMLSPLELDDLEAFLRSI